MRRWVPGTLLLAVVGSLSALGDSSPIPPVPQDLALTVDQVVEQYGPPDLAFGSILAYRTHFASLEADVSFFVLGDTVAEILFAFDAESNSLRSDADRVLKRLRVVYGPPTTVLRDRTQRTHRWEHRAGELTHTVVFTSGSEQHAIRTVRARTPGN